MREMMEKVYGFNNLFKLSLVAFAATMISVSTAKADGPAVAVVAEAAEVKAMLSALKAANKNAAYGALVEKVGQDKAKQLWGAGFAKLYLGKEAAGASFDVAKLEEALTKAPLSTSELLQAALQASKSQQVMSHTMLLSFARGLRSEQIAAQNSTSRKIDEKGGAPARNLADLELWKKPNMRAKALAAFSAWTPKDSGLAARKSDVLAQGNNPTFQDEAARIGSILIAAENYCSATKVTMGEGEPSCNVAVAEMVELTIKNVYYGIVMGAADVRHLDVAKRFNAKLSPEDKAKYGADKALVWNVNLGQFDVEASSRFLIDLLVNYLGMPQAAGQLVRGMKNISEAVIAVLDWAIYNQEALACVTGAAEHGGKDIGGRQGLLNRMVPKSPVAVQPVGVN
jgi:hypothetical protein